MSPPAFDEVELLGAEEGAELLGLAHAAAAGRVTPEHQEALGRGVLVRLDQRDLLVRAKGASRQQRLALCRRCSWSLVGESLRPGGGQPLGAGLDGLQVGPAGAGAVRVAIAGGSQRGLHGGGRGGDLR